MDPGKKIQHRLKKLCARNVLVIGIGNTLKGDDGAGPVICQRLKEAFSDRVIDTGTVPENYIQPIIDKNPKNLLIIDAVDFGASPGTVQIFDIEQINSIALSTHSLSPRLFVDVICQSISPDISFLGIQPQQTGLNQPLSPEVSRAVESLVDMFSHLLIRS